MKILNGLYSSDSGRVLFDGKEIHPQSSLEAQKLGISTIYQELNLIPELSICENIYIGREPMGKWGIDWKKIENNARELLAGIGLDYDVKQPLSLHRGCRGTDGSYCKSACHSVKAGSDG